MTEYDASSSEPYTRGWWLHKLSQEKKAHQDFRDDAEKAWKAYYGAPNRSDYFPIFWANTQIMHSAVYARQPIPDVRKRYQDAQVPKQLAVAIERALTFTLDQEDVDGHAHRIVDDFVIAGLGVGKVEYEAKTVEEPAMGPAGPLLDEATGEPILTKRIVLQRVWLEFKPWVRFHWEPSPDWEAVDWVCFDHLMSKDEVKERWGVDVSGGLDKQKDKAPPEAKYEPLTLVREIWCRKTRKVHWISDTAEAIDETLDDPLKLKGFYPCPQPMMLNLKDGSLLPKPDYSFIAKLCQYVDNLQDRVQKLTTQVKDIGVYDASFGTQLSKIMGGQDGARIPVENMNLKLKQGGVKPGFEGVICEVDNTKKVGVIQTLIELADKAKERIYEVTGISDIVRGSSQASETATAQQIKGQWANVRLARKQDQVARFFREMFRIMSEIIAEHFEPEQIALMTGVQLDQQAMDMLRSDVGRTFAIDVETDSTIAQDEAEDQKRRQEVVSTLLSNWQSVAALPGDFQKEVLRLMTGGMKYGKSLDEAIEALPTTQGQMQQLQQQVQQGQQQVAQLTKQLQGFQQGKEQRENAEAAADVQKTAADTRHTDAETVKLQLETQQQATMPVLMQ